MGAKIPQAIPCHNVQALTFKVNTALEIGMCPSFSGAMPTLGEHPFGIADEYVPANQYGTFVTAGTGVGRTGAAIPTYGAPLTVSAAGKLVPATTGNFIFARALGIANSADEYIEVLITREGKA